MTRFHVFQNLRAAAFLLGLVLVVAGLCGLWWLNRTGLPDSWRAAIEREAGSHGIHVTVGSLSYVPFKGIMAGEVRVFADPEKRRELSRLERLVVAVDRTKLARGLLRMTRVELSDARLVLPVDPDDPASPALEISDLNGTVSILRDRLIEVRGLSGRVGGVDVEVNARMLARAQDQSSDSSGEDTAEGARRALLGRVIQELEHWRFSDDQRPTLRMRVEGDISDRSTVAAKMKFTARALERNGYIMEEVELAAELVGNLLTITSLRAGDRQGSLEGWVDYDLQAREGRFDLTSTLDAMALVSRWLGVDRHPEVALRGEQWIVADGEFRLPAGEPPTIAASGRARVEEVTAYGVSFDSMEGLFSWSDGNFYLRDFRAVRPDGEVTGKLMVQPPLVRLALETSLPVEIYRPFFRDQPLGMVLGNFDGREGAEVAVRLDGGFDLSEPRSWAFAGRAAVKNMNYRGVPVHEADCHMALSRHELDFFEGTVVFDYSAYPLRAAWGGPRQATATVGRIRYNADTQLVEVDDVVGTIWPAPMVRLFAPGVADSLEIYRFYRPPRLTAAGVVDVTPRRRTSLDVDFSTTAPAGYRLFGKEVTLQAPRGKVRVGGDHVAVTGLRTTVFGGPVEAQIVSRSNGLLEGEVNWSALSLPEIAATYGSELKVGDLTGRVGFSLRSGRLSTLEGEGLLALEKGELFSVPMFGPLSPAIAAALGDRRAGFERAKDAFSTFRIRNGVLRSEDFYAATSSLVFTGEGDVNLATRSLDMTVRMNARGLLGLITLPLRPFYGLFQFRGTGPLTQPEWESVRFTSPPDAQNRMLLAPPPKAIRVEEN
jgi:hypothetical protein